MRRSRILLFVLLVGCTGERNHAPTDETMGSRLSELGGRTRDEVHEKEFRRVVREQLREQGLRVCEEGEWPQRWGEDCNVCGCEEGEVRSCTKVGCRRSTGVGQSLLTVDAPAETTAGRP